MLPSRYPVEVESVIQSLADAPRILFYRMSRKQLDLCLVYIMTCGDEPMEKLEFYPSQICLVPVHQPSRNGPSTERETRTNNLDSGCGRQQASSPAALALAHRPYRYEWISQSSIGQVRIQIAFATSPRSRVHGGSRKRIGYRRRLSFITYLNLRHILAVLVLF